MVAGWCVVEMGNRRKTNNNITQRWLLKLFSFVQSFFSLQIESISLALFPVRCSLLFGFTWLRIWIVLAAICARGCVCVCVCVCALANFIIIGTSPGTRLAAFYGAWQQIGARQTCLISHFDVSSIKSSDKFNWIYIGRQVDWQPWLANDDWAVQIKKFITKPDNKAATDRQKAA